MATGACGLVLPVFLWLVLVLVLVLVLYWCWCLRAQCMYEPYLTLICVRSPQQQTVHLQHAHGQRCGAVRR